MAPIMSIRPAPPVTPPGSSLTVWICVVVAVVVVAAAGVYLASRH